jgi:hypothetical protein
VRKPPGSELSIHERWFSRAAMDFLLIGWSVTTSISTGHEREFRPAARKRVHLRVAGAQPLDKRCINLDLDTLHIDSLRLVPTAHLGEHLSGFKAVSRPSL